MQIDDLRSNQLIILECLSGSKAYGLSTPASDTDIKGVYVLPKQQFYSLSYTAQLNDESNDVMFYELGRFVELLAVNNPNILELLNSPSHAIIKRHPILAPLHTDVFLSKLCKNTFGKYALSQIKKARGLNKKIVNPMSKERKLVEDFCYVSEQSRTLSLKQFLLEKNWSAPNCGLVNLPHMKNLFGLYYEENLGFKGISNDEHSNDICLSSIPKESSQRAVLYFNKDGYSKYCKDYKEYWRWVSVRNEVRFNATKEHNKNYDAKNMMHTFRLLDMAIEIGREQKVNVMRPDRDFLLGIKRGEYAYEDLLKMAEERQGELERVFEHSDLPDRPDMEKINSLLFNIRETFYSNKNYTS